MEPYEIDSFADELVLVKNLLLRMEAASSLLAVAGMRRVSTWSEYNVGKEALLQLESKLSSVLKISRFVDTEIHERLLKISEESPIISHVAEIGIAIQIAEYQTKNGSGLSVFDALSASFSRTLRIPRFQSLFADEGQIPIRRMLVDVERVIPLVQELSRTAWRKSFGDDETFKPSNINIERVNLSIEKAIISIDSSVNINAETKLKLSQYLTEAKTELIKEQPAWKKIVGALVIVSAILGGLAAAPEAYKSVNEAIQIVLGSSIDHVVPKSKTGPTFLQKADPTPVSK